MSWHKDQGNYAKEQADRAKVEADAAKESVEYIEAKKPLIEKFTDEQTNLQAQVDTLVINGDSSPAAAQAAVNAEGVNKGTLKARLDDDYNKVTQQLADITHDMSALAGDGVADDGIAIQNIINKAISNKVKKITFPKATYRINNGLAINGGDIEIDFSGSEILSFAKSNSNIWGEFGLFNFKGEFSNGDVLSYMRSGFKTVPTNSSVLISFESIDSSITGSSYSKYSRIKTSDNSLFSIGDDLLLYGVTTVTYRKDSYDPFLMMCTRVIAIDDTYVYVDYYSPYKFNAFLNTPDYPSRVIKLNMIKNVKLKNATIIDMTTLATKGSPTQQEVKEAISPVTAICVDGLTLENVNVRNNKYNGFNAWYSRNIKVNGLTVKDPQMWGGGQGYATQIRACQEIELNKVIGEKCRHVIDFSFSAYAVVNDSYGIETREKEIDMHGLCEHDITWNRCTGQIILGNSIKDFPNMVANINFVDCVLKNMDNVGSFLDERFIENIHFLRCNITTRYFFNYQQTTIKDSSIHWIAHPVVPVVPKRNQDVTTRLQMENCKIKVYIADNAARFIYMADYDELNIRDSELVYDKTSIAEDVGMTLTLLQCKNINFDNFNMEATKIRISNSKNAELRVNIINSKYRQAGTESYWLTLYDLRSCKVFISINNNLVEHVGTVVQWFAIDVRNTNMTGATIVAQFKDNTFKGNSGAKPYYINSESAPDTSKLTAFLYDSGNVVIHKDPSGSNKWSTENKFITA